MHLDAHSRMGLGRERIALQSNAAERDRLRRSLAQKRHDDERQLLQRARRRLNAAQARAQ